MQKEFKNGEIVWAKVRGFPWWPALMKGLEGKIIFNKDNKKNSQSKKIKVDVHFIGHNSRAELPIDKIEKFDVKLDQFSKTKKRILLESIRIAKKIISGEISYDNHLKYLNKIKIKDQSDNEIKENKILDKNDSFTKLNSEENIKLKDNNNYLGKKIQRSEEEIKNNISMFNKTNRHIELYVNEDKDNNIFININIC